jgi:hypothetical protein
MSKDYMFKSHDQWIADYVETRFHAAIQSGNRRSHYAVLAVMRGLRYETPKARKLCAESARQWAQWASQDYADAIGFAAKGNRL